MIHALRAFVKSWFATALLSILILAFVITGIYTQNNIGGAGGGNDAVAVAGQHQMKATRFRQEFQRNMQEAAQRNGGQAPPLRDAIRAGLDQRVLSDVKQQLAFYETLRRVGVRPSPRLVINQIRQETSLFNPVTGQFDRTLYARFLQNVEATPEDFEGYLSDNIAQNHFLSGMFAGFDAPRIYVAMGASLQAERRDASYVAIPASAFQPPAQPTDAVLQAFVQSHQEAFQVPERRVITVVRFSAAALAPTMPVDEAAVQRTFQFRQETLSQPEKRSFVQIPIRQASEAARVAAALRAGQDPAVIARSVGTEAITYDDRPQSAVSDRRIGQAAFGMRAGEVSGAVQGDVGLAVIRLTTITPGHQAVLTPAIRQEIENQIRAQAAERRANELSEAFDEALQGGASIASAAQTAGVTSVTLGPIYESGRDAQGQINQAVLTAQIVQTAFHDLTQGQESDLIEVSRGESYAVRVERVMPRSTATLAEMRTQIERQYMSMRFAELIEARQNEVEARLRRGESLEAVAAAMHGEVGHVAGQGRQPNPQDPVLTQDFVQRLFATNRNEIFKSRLQNAIAVGRVTAIHPGDLSLVGAMIQQYRPQLSQQVFESGMSRILEWCVNLTKPRAYLDRARRALNVDPSMLPPEEQGATNGARAANAAGGANAARPSGSAP